MSKARRRGLRPAGSPEAAFSARSCLRLTDNQPLGPRWPATQVFDIALHREQAGHERPEASRRPMQREEEGVEVVHGRAPPGSEVSDELELLQPALRISTRALRTSGTVGLGWWLHGLGWRLHARSLRRLRNGVSSVLSLEGEAGQVHQHLPMQPKREAREKVGLRDRRLTPAAADR